MSADQVAARRTEKKDDNKAVEPLELLNLVASDIETWQIKPDALYVVAIEKWEGTGNPQTINRYRCGMSRADELAHLVLAQHIAVEYWKD